MVSNYLSYAQNTSKDDGKRKRNLRAPRDDGPPLNALNKVTNGRIGFSLGGVVESNEESLDNVQERNHGTDPVDPASTKTVVAHCEFSGVSDRDHGSTGNSKSGCFRSRFIGGQLHDEDDFNEKKWNGKKPVHVTVRVVERFCGSRKFTFGGPFVSFGPRIEDTKIMVGRNEGDQSGDDQCTLVLLVYTWL